MLEITFSWELLQEEDDTIAFKFFLFILAHLQQVKNDMNVRSLVDMKKALSRRAYQTSTLRCRSSSTGSSLQPQPTVAWPPAQTPGRLGGRPLGWVSKEGTWADEGNAWTKTAEGSLSI